MKRRDFDFRGVWHNADPSQQQFHLIAHKVLLKEDLPDAEKPRTEHQNKRPDGIVQLFVQGPDGYVIEFNGFNAQNP